MLKRLLATIILLLGSHAWVNEACAQVAIAPTNTAPNASAMLEVISTTKGLLAPRMTSAQRQAIPAPANGLLVFQTNNGVNADTTGGYWYYDALLTKWVPLMGTEGWTVLGNAGTNSNFHYVGTSDLRNFRIATQNAERLRINETTGYIGINTAANPSERLEVNGAMRVHSPALIPTNNEGSIRWNPTLSSHEGNTTGAATGWYELENAWQHRSAQPYPITGVGCVYDPDKQIGTGTTQMWSTIQTPYSVGWEDGRHQYLWHASEFAAAGICPNMDITGVKFNVGFASASVPYVLIEIKMKNTATATMTNFDYAGLQFVGSNPGPWTPTPGWNTHAFNASPFQWNGASNVILEFCNNNYSWAGNSSVLASTTPFASGYGLYCDACGGFGPVPCTPTVPPNPGCGTGPCGPGCPGVCSGYSSTPGCNLTNTSSLVTCDGTYTWNGSQGAFSLRPNVRFMCHATGSGTLTLNSNYLYSTQAVLIGDAAWAASNNGMAMPNTLYAFRGPGTITAQNSVWARNLILNDHVLDAYYDGQVRPEDYDAARTYRRYAIDEMANYVERERHLPTMGGRAEWEQQGLFPVDQLTNQLWVTVEDQALYIKELKERMDLLQQFLIQKRLQQLVPPASR